MVFNGVSLDDLIIVEKVDNPPIPAVQITTQSAPGKHGARFVSKKLSTRTIKVTVVVAGYSRADYVRQVDRAAAILYAPDEARLSGLPGDPRFYNATMSRWTMDKLMTIGKGSIEFFCSDPFGYGWARALPLGTEGMILGSTDTRGIISQRITEAVPGDLVFERTGTGELIRLFGPFEAGLRVVVDTEKGYATINGVSAMDRVDIASEWFSLPPGKSTISVSPATLTGGTYTYLERWL